MDAWPASAPVMIVLVTVLLAGFTAQEPEPPIVAEEIVGIEETKEDVADLGAGADDAAPFSFLLLEPAAPSAAIQDPWQDPDAWLKGLEFGLLLDFFTAFTEKADSDDAFNEVRVRSARLHARAPVDASTTAFVTMDYGDPGDGAEFSLREAALRVERLPLPGWPERFHLLVGQYFADLGPWNTVLPGEFAAPQLDGFRRLYLGGNLAARGVEAHHEILRRDWKLRWSLGLAGELEGQNLDANEFGIPTASAVTPFGRSGFRNWAGNGRVEARWDLSGGRAVRAGASALYAPEEVKYTTVPGFGVMRDEANHYLGGLDVGYRHPVGPDRFHEFSAEIWVDDDQYRVGTPSTLVDERELGGSLLYTYQHDREWSFGGQYSQFDQPSPGVDLDGHFHSIWASYRLSAGNRVTFFLTHTNPAQYEQKWFTVGAQWTVELGAKRAESRRTWN